LLRGELKSAQQIAEDFLQLAKSEGQQSIAAVVSRNLGLTRLHQGVPVEARALLEEALRNHDLDYDTDAKIHFAQDHRAAAKPFLAEAAWVLGDLGYAGALVAEAVARAVDTSHPPTVANTLGLKAQIEILRGDAQAAQRSSERITALAQEHGLALMQSHARLYSAWARAVLGDLEAGREELQRAREAYVQQGNGLYVPWFRGLLAELDAKAGSSEQAGSCVDAALAAAAETGEHWTDAFLHRIRGEILWRRDPSNTRPAEEAFLTAIAIAQQQKARSFELQAALRLAKLYQSAGHAADACAVLGPVVEGLSPTPECSEIEQAQALLTALQ
jgi:predicted ATPase